MPGRIDMDQQGAVGSVDLKKDRSHAQIAQSAPAVQSQSAQQTNGMGQANGQNGSLPNGVDAHDAAPPTTNGDAKSSSIALADTNTPPLDQSWREQPTNKSLGKLLSRVSQQCFNDLNATLTAMNEVQDDAQRPQVNGAQQSALDTSEASLRKKRMLMEFANSQRDRFIKALVLSDVSRNQEDQARLIDVKVWQDKQFNSYRAAMHAMGVAKLNMIDVKQASPNIEGAMEFLSTGKSSRMPHLGYIPQKKATAKELLKTLRDMNVIIATRLNLHDELSPHMQEYDIADGRVTFKVPGEFEVDLSVGDDDPESQFFFLDLRLAFKPSTGAISDTLRSHLEGRVNHALMEKGLNGCYEFLHNFVLTHKINVLRSQVAELVQGKWFDCIRAENMRRSLTVQYWTGRPGPKSWIEIGIGSGKVKGRSRKPQTSCLSVRWFRRGVEVKGESLDLNWDDISLERCLSTVIEKHTSWILDDLQSRIKALVPAGTELGLESVDDGSGQRSMKLTAPSLHTPIQLRLEAVTGQYSISPPSGPTARAERYLKNDAAADPAQWLANTLCAVAQENVHKGAELLHWGRVPHLLRQDNLQKIFGDGIRAHSTFLPRKAWGDHWALAVTFSLAGATWWAASLEEKRNDRGEPVGKIISNARQVRHVLGAAIKDMGPRSALLQIERSAVAEVAFGALSTQFDDMQIKHRFERMREGAQGGEEKARDSTGSEVALFFTVGQLLKTSKTQGQSWTNNVARLTHHGMIDTGPDQTGVRHDLRLALASGKMRQLQTHLTHFKDRNLVLSDDGGVALRILAPFGKPFAEQIRSRLLSIERLDRYVRALQKHGLECTHVSLSRLSFNYGKEPELSATLLFPSSEGLPVRLKLSPSDINPHTRTKILLEHGLNEIGELGVEALGFTLLLTLPLLQAFERIEAAGNKKSNCVSIQPQTCTRFLLKYIGPFPTCKFEIRSRLRKEGKKKVIYWGVQLKRDASGSGALAGLLRQEVWSKQGQGWRGVGNGVVATVAGIAAVIEKIHAVVERCEGAAGAEGKDGKEETPARGQGQTREEGKAPPPQPPAQGQGQSQSQGPSQSQGQGNPPNQRSSQGQQQPQQKLPVKKEHPDVIMLD